MLLLLVLLKRLFRSTFSLSLFFFLFQKGPSIWIQSTADVSLSLLSYLYHFLVSYRLVMSGSYACLLLLLLLLFSSSVHSQSTFERGERIPLLYNKIFSHRTLLPYSYASLPFICPPYTEEDWSHKSRMSSWLAVDQDWFGDYPILSDYKVKKID